MRTGPPSTAAVLTTGALVVFAAGSIWLNGPPPIPETGAGEAGFSTDRAMAHVEEIAQRPHPMGSAEHARVRDYLAHALQGMQLVVEHQQTTVTRVGTRGGYAGPVRVGRVHNLLARIRGTDSSGAILLVSHYDSVPAAPGAADASSCVAAILESVRVLREGSALRNDVIVLLTDGEEEGLLGASAFVDEHPWAKDIRLILNFEARGTGGPSQMFETSTGNGRVVGQWAWHTPHATGSSLGYEIYKRLPNDTDFSVLKHLDAEGLNFAFIENVEAYHTPADNPASLEHRSLQAHGSTALELMRRFGAIDLSSLDARDAVFFSLPLGYAVSYSTLWVFPLTGLMIAAWILALLYLRKRGAASIGGTVLGLVGTAAFAAAAVFTGLRYPRFPAWLHDRWLAEGAVTTNAAYAFALVCLLAGVWLAIQALVRLRLAAHSLAMGASGVWMIAAGAAAWWLPGATYVVFWPLAGALVSTLVLPGDTAKLPPPLFVLLLLWALAVPTLALVAPTAASLFSAVGIGTEGGAAIAFCTALGLGTLVPHLDVAIQGRRWWPALVALLAGAGAVAAGSWTAPYGPSHPKPVNLLYVLDADSGKAQWASATSRMHPWLDQYLTAAPSRGPLGILAGPRVSGEYSYHDAPAIPLAPPEAAIVGDTTADGDRLVTLRVVSPRGARVVSVRIPDASVGDMWIEDKRVGGGNSSPGWEQGRWSIDYINPPASGFQLRLRLRGQVPFTVVLADRSHGLPEIPGRAFDPRPPSLTTIQQGDVTVVGRSLKF
jgi:hypothetical protein